MSKPLTSSQKISGPAPARSPRRAGGRWWRWLGLGLAWLVLALVSVWAVAALWFDVPVPILRAPLAVAYGLGVVAVWIFARRRLVAMSLTAGGFVLVLVWWFTLAPSNDRDWQPDLAVLPWAEVSGNRVLIHHVRHCEYRTELDFDVRHADRTFDLDQLQTVDMFLVHWGAPLIAHMMVSFTFQDADPVCFSIEVRKEKGEGYSALKAFFRQFELTYVIADERDLVRLRTNYRQGEDVTLYRVRMTPEKARRLFLQYLRRANELKARAEWYNVLTSNCSTGIHLDADAAPRFQNRWDWRILANGRSDQMLYESGVLAGDLPFAELKQKCSINARGRAADHAADYSKQIRAGLPGQGP